MRLVIDSVPAESAVLLFQSDIKREGRWIDKGALVISAAEAAGAHVLFHKIVSRREPGQLTYGRPGYTHFIAISRQMRCPDVLPIPDIVIDAGPARWVRAMGIRAAAHAIRFARAEAKARVIFDPFCGAWRREYAWLDAIGVERSKKRAEQSRLLVVPPHELEPAGANSS